MRVAIFGMGYVGVVSAACLARDGHEVLAIERAEGKARDIERGRSPIQEDGISELVAEGVASGCLRMQEDPAAAVRGADLVWICVGTPSDWQGGVDLTSVLAVLDQIGAALASMPPPWPDIVLRSTVPPGTTRDRILPRLAARLGQDADRLHVVFHPEFLREGSAISDFDAPTRIVIGETKAGAGARLALLYGDAYSSPRFVVGSTEAELLKYADNAFHALKITFANEIGAVARHLGVDGRHVADMFCADTKLNISPAYLRPGFAFGGSCLPKDLRALTRLATEEGVPVPLLASILPANEAQIEHLVRRVMARAPRRVGMVGLAFKRGTDDMRESPFVVVAKRLIGEGVELRIFDPVVQPSRLVGANKLAVEQALRHLERVLVSELAELDGCDAVLINHASVDSATVSRWLEAGASVLDLAGLAGAKAREGYEGIAW